MEVGSTEKFFLLTIPFVFCLLKGALFGRRCLLEIGSFLFGEKSGRKFA